MFIFPTKKKYCWLILHYVNLCNGFFSLSCPNLVSIQNTSNTARQLHFLKWFHGSLRKERDKVMYFQVPHLFVTIHVFHSCWLAHKTCSRVCFRCCMCKCVHFSGLLCGSRGNQSSVCVCVCVYGHWGGLCACSWQSKQMYACHSLIRHICHCHDETVCLRKPPRDFQRDIWVTLVLTSAICALGFGIWQVYIQQEVTNMHYTYVICPHYLLWETPANSLTLCTVISPDWQPSRTSHWFVTSFDLPCHKSRDSRALPWQTDYLNTDLVSLGSKRAATLDRCC